MERNKKQLLVYLSLIIVSAVLIYLQIDYSQAFSEYESINSLARPQYNPYKILFLGIIGGEFTFQTHEIILMVLAVLAPIWMLSGFYFARKMEMPGMYSDNRMSSKEFCFFASFCIIWGIILPLITSHDSNIMNLFNEFLFLILAGCIFAELFLRLFLVSFISWLLNVLFKAKLSRMTILLLSAAVSVVPVFLFTYIRHSISDLPLFEWIFTMIIGNFLLNWIYISRGVLTTIVVRICAFTLNYLVVLVIL